MTNILTLILAAAFGLCGWFWHGAVYRADIAQSANTTLLSELESLRASGPAIAAQVERMAAVVSRSSQLSWELKENAAQLQTMADCAVPVELQRLSQARIDEINANARADEAAAAGLRAGVRD